MDDLVYQFNGAAIEVLKALGSGLLLSIYHECMKHELDLRCINYCSEYVIPIKRKGFKNSTILRCDLLVEDILAVELKAVTEIQPIFETILFSN